MSVKKKVNEINTDWSEVVFGQRLRSKVNFSQATCSTEPKVVKAVLRMATIKSAASVSKRLVL